MNNASKKNTLKKIRFYLKTINIIYHTMSNNTNTELKTAQLGELKFTYEESIKTSVLNENEWFIVYYGVILENGHKVDQISVHYDFNAPTKENNHKSYISVHFEKDIGSLDTDVDPLRDNALNDKHPVG